MSRTMAIAGRELRAYLLSPGGYIIIALFTLMTGFFFSIRVLESGQIASLRSVFGAGTWLLAIIAPAITMRLFSEEFRLGTFEALMTCPVREVEVVIGKFLGALGLLTLMLTPTLVYVVPLELYGQPGPDYGELLCGYLGLMLAGGVYLASGMLASTFTGSQPVAFLMALFFWLAVGVSAKLLPPYLDDRLAGLIYTLDPDLRLNDFTIGLIDTSNVVYFVSLTVILLVAAVVSLQIRRWR